MAKKAGQALLSQPESGKGGAKVKPKKPPVSQSANHALSNARKAKRDEFYTQLNDISNELKHYKEKFSGKTVFCNCDNPYESNFFKYFALNFNTLGLKKLIATSYKKSPIVGGELSTSIIEGLKPEGKEPYAIVITKVPKRIADKNGKELVGMQLVESLLKHEANTAHPLEGDGIYNGGDFRSRECVELLEQADIVVTNPPFSLFREYVAQLVAHDKQFLIIGNVNAITYKEIFPLIKANKLWFGPSIRSGDREFGVPDDYPLNAAGFRVDNEGRKYIRVKGVRWFTNLDYRERHEEITLYKKYTLNDYPTYDNYDAIEVSKVAEIPVDYDNAMGVPITFLDKYNPEQFEILGITDRDNNSGLKTKEYTREDVPNPGDLNRRGVIRIGNEYKSTYARLLIKRRRS